MFKSLLKKYKLPIFLFLPSIIALFAGSLIFNLFISRLYIDAQSNIIEYVQNNVIRVENIQWESDDSPSSSHIASGKSSIKEMEFIRIDATTYTMDSEEIALYVHYGALPDEVAEKLRKPDGERIIASYMSLNWRIKINEMPKKYANSLSFIVKSDAICGITVNFFTSIVLTPIFLFFLSLFRRPGWSLPWALAVAVHLITLFLTNLIVSKWLPNKAFCIRLIGSVFTYLMLSLFWLITLYLFFSG